MSKGLNYSINSYFESLKKLEEWLVIHNFKAYDPFDGLSSPLSTLTFNNRFLQKAFQQFIKRNPYNLRPYIGIKPERSTKGISFIGAGYLNLFQATDYEYYKTQAESCFDWLMSNYSKGYSGFCWGNSFNYASRAFYLPKYAPTLVWTALIGHHFVEAYRILKNVKYLDVLNGIGKFILNDLPRKTTKKGICISYVAHENVPVHNANLLGARLLAEIFNLTGCLEYKELSELSVEYSINCQREDGSWYYGEESKFHWIDNWHTAYNLDSILGFQLELGSDKYKSPLRNGFDFYLNHFFREDGAPRFYWDKDYKFDIQSSSQSIDTLISFYKFYKEKRLFEAALKTADWTINYMQDPSGYFYLWRNIKFVNKTPTLHWGAGTMFHALSNIILEGKNHED